MAVQNRFNKWMDRIKNINALVTFIGVIFGGVGFISIVGVKYITPSTNIEQYQHIESNLIKLILLLSSTLIAIAIISGIFLYRRIKAMLYETDPGAFKIAVNKLLEVWGEHAKETAICDSRLFEYLFVYTLVGLRGEAQSFDRLKEHIPKVLDYASKAFRIITNDKCSVAIKCAIPSSNTLQTLYRDNENQNARRIPDNIVEVLSFNKPLDEIARKQVSHYVEDDLRAAAYLRQYQNSYDKWNELFNATIIHPIGIYAGERPRTSTSRRVRRLPDDVMYLICVENVRGGFKNEFCLSLARYISYRLSPMIYRAELLKIILSQK